MASSSFTGYEVERCLNNPQGAIGLLTAMSKEKLVDIYIKDILHNHESVSNCRARLQAKLAQRRGKKVDSSPPQLS